MLIVADAARCPYCARVRIVLAEKGLPAELVPIDLENRPEWLYAWNPPDARVPVLEDDGWVLPESAVICEYLEERFPEPPLLPADPGERAVARLRIFRFEELSRPYYALRRGRDGAREELEEVLRALDGELGSMPFLGGRSFGLADVAYVPWILRARQLLGVDLAAFPSLERWLASLLERPSIGAELAIVETL